MFPTKFIYLLNFIYGLSAAYSVVENNHGREPVPHQGFNVEHIYRRRPVLQQGLNVESSYGRRPVPQQRSNVEQTYGGRPVPLQALNSENTYGRRPVPQQRSNAEYTSEGRSVPQQGLNNENTSGRRPVPQQGVNASCSHNLRITALTNQLLVNVSQDPHWDEESGSIYFANELPPLTAVHRYIIDTKEHYHVELGCESVSSPIPIKDAPGKYFFACSDYLSILTWDGKSQKASFQNLTKPDPENSWPSNRVKSGKVAPSGALLIYNDPNGPQKVRSNTSLLAYINGKKKVLAEGFTYGTGIGFSRDGRWLYFSDLAEKHVYKARYNPKHDSIEDLRLLLNFTIAGLGFADSLTVDSEDYIWVASFLTGLIVKLDPHSGDVICTIELPVKTVTNISFGRCPNAKYGTLNCLYAMSVKNELDGPSSGTLLLIEGINASGVPPFPLRLNTILGNHRRSYGG